MQGGLKLFVTKRYVIIKWSLLHGVNKYGFEASDIWLDPSCLLEVNYQRGEGGEQVKSWTPNGQYRMGRGYLNMQSMSQTW